MSQNNKILKKIGAEFLMGIFGALGTHVETKVGLGVFLLIVGLGILLSPKTQDIDYFSQCLVGVILIVMALILFIWRIKQLKKNENTE
ncbi:hypothetical protein LPB90_12940 [Chryseobacterium sp. LC2016-29]|uniref:hypothetical protein n=1 Tax=Chryseobacterium sp. LC2016-29 TaxID=2897331 RepID=UPI001E63C5A6|nr:hypothetical protein [Chryseobacterium sp. LC2016-29]MCD0479366.1 hypothetical protein [Chryseobacterium sp. LC2016-29]